MTDLTKLTTEELVHLVAGHMPATAVEIRRRLKGCEEYSAGFDLRWDSDMRAIKRWKKAHPGMNALVWPDHTDLSVWLLERLEKCEAALRPYIDKHDCPLCTAARAALEEKSFSALYDKAQSEWHAKEAVEAERERCAKIAERPLHIRTEDVNEWLQFGPMEAAIRTSKEIAAQIREGKK